MSDQSTFNSFYSEIKQEMGVKLILKESYEQLNELFNFETIAFMLINEQDHSFNLIFCAPQINTDMIQSEIDYQIEKGVFAWALNQTKPIMESAKNNNTIIFNALATRSRIRGMFIGLFASEQLTKTSHTLEFLNTILFSVSNALENYELYDCIQQQNKQLEQTISQRTSELKKAKLHAEKVSDAKSLFLAHISHEIRTPLTAILGYADLIRYEQLSSSEQTTAVNDILQASTHLSGIINNILDISKIEAKKLDVECIPVSLFNLLNETSAITRRQAKKKGLAFTIHYQFPLPQTINTDPTRLKQILLNLCNNAVKFTEQGEINIQVSYQPALNQIIFSIIDSGIGISLEQQKNIFQHFAQADISITRNFGGTGLGLVISKQLAEILGGTITLQSEVNEGCHFQLTINTGELPEEFLIYHLDQLPHHPEKTNPWSANSQLFGHILLAEDNINNQQLIRLFLNKAGINVDIASNGSEAVEMALVNHYDLILMDMQMPEMNGIEATTLLRDMSYIFPIVALTANATIDIKRQCHEVGFDGFLTKPIEVDAFFTVLSQYLRTSVKTESVSLDKDLNFQSILNEFIESLPQMLKSMDSAFQQQQWQELASLAHQLKGVAGGYGHPKLGATAGLIVTESNPQNQEKVQPLLDSLNHNLAKIINAQQK